MYSEFVQYIYMGEFKQDATIIADPLLVYPCFNWYCVV